MKSSDPELVGKDLVFTVSEPWAYAFPDGGYSIVARIVSYDPDAEVLWADAGFEVPNLGDTVRGSLLEISARHVGYEVGQFVDSENGLPVGVGIIPTGGSRGDAVYAFIGSIKLARDPSA